MNSILRQVTIVTVTMDIVKTRKRMLVLEELASEMSQAEVAPDDSSGKP